MFELPEDKEEKGTRRLLIGVCIVVVLLIAAALLYLKTRPRATPRAPVGAAAVPAAVRDADPVRDLRVLRATMGKDRTGTVAVWAIGLRNKSSAYTYSNIQYEATYIGADEKVLLLNKGTLSLTMEPGAEKDVPELRDAFYPTGTAWYKFRITGATAKAR